MMKFLMTAAAAAMAAVLQGCSPNLTGLEVFDGADEM